MLDKALAEKELLRQKKKGKKSFGPTALYLTDLTVDKSRPMMHDTEEPVVVSEEQLKAAYERINQQFKQLSDN